MGMSVFKIMVRQRKRINLNGYIKVFNLQILFVVLSFKIMLLLVLIVFYSMNKQQSSLFLKYYIAVKELV